ncbi:MAG TPA: hypothetical protein VFL97_07670 [Nitrococcus sp.]|nr:hypothetical protein [Nitrococcus sp.]
MINPRRTLLYCSTLSLGMLASMLLGVATHPRAAHAGTACPKQACDTEKHYCFNTDINYQCWENGPFADCSSLPC